MPKVLSLIGLVFILTGIVLTLVAMNHRSPQHPFESGSTRARDLFRPIWMMRDWFTPPGYSLHLLGYVLLALGCLIMPVYHWLLK
jgi:uncharacterized membrane protein